MLSHVKTRPLQRPQWHLMREKNHPTCRHSNLPRAMQGWKLCHTLLTQDTKLLPTRTRQFRQTFENDSRAVGLRSLLSGHSGAAEPESRNVLNSLTWMSTHSLQRRHCKPTVDVCAAGKGVDREAEERRREICFGGQ